MKRIKLFSDFCTSSHAKYVYEYYYDLKKYYITNKEFIFVDDESYTHAIILNQAMPNLHINKENVIGLAFEPTCLLYINSQFVEYAQKNIGKYCIGLKENLPYPFIEYYSFMWCELCPPITSIKRLEFSEKKYIMSLILSNKKQLPGHIYRHELVIKILESNLPIHIYGCGTHEYMYDERVKGRFDEWHLPYEDYKYTIAIENTESNDYISEKYTNAILYNSIPLYWGANNVEKYFGKEWGYRLTGDIEEDFKLIANICTNCDSNKIDLKNAYYEFSQGKAYLPTLLKNL